MKKIIFLLSFLFAQTILAATKADFLIVSHPQKLSIYNRYEQPLPESEWNQFLPYAPFQVIRKNELLGDQITEALRFSYQGNHFFLLTDDKGNIVNKTGVQYLKTFQQTMVYNDTVYLRSPVSLFESYPSNGSSFSVGKDERVIRIFKYNSSFYLLHEKPLRYGWYTGRSDVFRKIQVVPMAETVNTADIQNRIQSRLDAANESYGQIFSFFNQVTNQQKSIPQWKLESTGSTITCNFVGSNLVSSQLEQSTRYIVQDIEQILLGKPFTVTYSAGRISIDRRN